MRLLFVLFALQLFGGVFREEFANGLWIESTLDEQNRLAQITFPDGSLVTYDYEQDLLKAVTRISPTGEVLYKHTYDVYDDSGRLLGETHRIPVNYGYDSLGRPAYRADVYLSEIYVYDDRGNLAQKGAKSYAYDSQSQLVSETPNGFTAKYDDIFNCIELNGQSVSLQDPPVNNDMFDASGRRLTHGDTSYLYLGNEEIGAYENGKMKEMRILGGFRRAVGIEIDSVAYIPIHDVQGVIRYLVDWNTGEIKERNDCDAFGRGVNPKIPYAYFGKRYDVDTGLYYFGKRFYDPKLTRWVSPDPIGPVHSSNLYQYVYNNPFRYIDPQGESIWGYIGGIGEIALGGAICITGGILEVASLGTYTIGFGIQEAAGFALITDGLNRSIYHAQDLTMNKGKEDRQRNGMPKNNRDQNKQANDARNDIEKKLGRKLSDREKQELHRFIHGRNYNYHDIVEEGYWLFHGR